MSSSLPEGYTARTATLADAPAVAELVRACELDVLGIGVISDGDILERWRMTDPAENVWLVHAGERLAAAATLWFYGVAIVWADVHPQHTGRGIGTALLELVEGRAREAGETIVRNDAFAKDARATAFMDAHGYRSVRHYYEMRIELGDEPPRPEWPEGIGPKPFGVEDAEAFHTAINEAFEEEWGHAPMAFEEWRRTRIEADDFDPAMWTIVWDGDEVAGVARCEPFLFGGGWVAALGVRKLWRRRGLGLALLHHLFGIFHERGERSVGLGVDSENPTGATRLYERAGMHVASESVTFEKTLA